MDIDDAIMVALLVLGILCFAYIGLIGFNVINDSERCLYVARQYSSPMVP